MGCGDSMEGRDKEGQKTKPKEIIFICMLKQVLVANASSVIEVDYNITSTLESIDLGDSPSEALVTHINPLWIFNLHAETQSELPHRSEPLFHLYVCPIEWP